MREERGKKKRSQCTQKKRHIKTAAAQNISILVLFTSLFLSALEHAFCVQLLIFFIFKVLQQSFFQPLFHLLCVSIDKRTAAAFIYFFFFPSYIHSSLLSALICTIYTQFHHSIGASISPAINCSALDLLNSGPRHKKRRGYNIQNFSLNGIWKWKKRGRGAHTKKRGKN